MYFYGLSGYGYTPAFPYETRSSTLFLPSELPDEKTTPKYKRISRRVSIKVRQLARHDGPPVQEKEQPENLPKSLQSPLLRLASWLHPCRWLRKKVKHAATNSTSPPIIPPINVGDRLFLETLVRHAEENSYSQQRLSPLPLLHRTSEAPTFESFRGASMPPGIATAVEYDLFACDPNRVQYGDGRPYRAPLSSPPDGGSSYRINNSPLMLRSPHPPSSYQAVQPGVIYSRQSSRQSTQSACSNTTSAYDPCDFRISSLSGSVLSGATSPLFYRPSQNSTPITPASPPTNEQVIRHKSTRITSQGIIPVQPTPRASSLTVSIRTEEGIEDLEFPSPPRWSGCWFSDRDNSQTPKPPIAEKDDDQSDYGDYDEKDEDDVGVTIAALARVSEKSQSRESFTDSLAGSGSMSMSSLQVPHMRTFGPHATSFLSLKAHCQSQPAVTVSEPSKPPTLVTMPSFENYDGEHEEMDSVCSTFADISMSSGIAFDGNDPLSDTGSHIDPSFLRLHA